jgi:hypothetical protein
MDNGMKYCSSPVLPQNKLDHCIKTLDMNAKMKATNNSIMVCQKANSTKSWSDSPTAGRVTDPCESMLITKWKSAVDWTPYHVSQFLLRWLAVHRGDKVPSQFNYWANEEESEEVESDCDDKSESEPE